MITVIYTCDRCGSAYPTDDKMWNVGIAVENRSSPGYYNRDWLTNKFQHQQLWCEICINQVRLKAPQPRSTTEPTPPTFEDILRAIVREEVEITKQ